MSHLSLEELRNIARFLRISVENKTAMDLGLLIKEATTKKPPSQSSDAIHSVLSKQFEEGRFTDCSIRVKLKEVPIDQAADRPPKRLRSGTSEPLGAEPDRPADKEEENVRVIKAHAVILASRSPYFERAMGGEWRESQDRSFDVEVADEQEYVTFRRIIKLCYGSTFIKEDGRDLDFSELVRLIHVANAFECVDAVRECVAALEDVGLDWEKAVQCLELAGMLDSVEGMGGLAKKATRAITREVGPVHELFAPVEDEEDGGDVLGGMRISEKVKHLSPSIFEALLHFDRLQLKTDNEAFWLLLAWVEAQSEESEEGKQALFTRMAKGLRFHAMDPGYILLLVSKHPRIIAAGLESTALRASLTHSNLARRTVQEVGAFQVEAWHHDHAPPASSSSSVHSRGGEGSATWVFPLSFSAADVASMIMGTYEGRHKVVGLVAGLPWYVELVRDDTGTAGGGKAAVYTMCSLPFEWMGFEGRAGFYFSYIIEVGVGAPDECSLEEPTSKGAKAGARCWTTSPEYARGGTFGAWEEVFKRGSGYLFKGELRMVLSVTIANDQGPSLSADATAAWEAQETEGGSEDEDWSSSDDPDDSEED